MTKKSLLVCAGALCLALVGCTDAGPAPESSSAPLTAEAPTTSAPKPRPSAVATTGPNVPRGAKPPVLSSHAKQPTVTGAQSFVIYALATMNWGYATLDTTLLKGASAPGCVACKQVADGIDEMAAYREYIKGGHLRLTSIAGALTDPVKFEKANYAFDIQVSVQTRTVFDATGKRLGGPYKGEVATNRFYVGWFDGGWKLVESVGVVQK